MRVILKSKIHRARITRVNVDYEGSATIDRKLMEEADILPYEKVHVLNVNNDARFTTYAIEGEDGEICLNGAAARLAAKGDAVVILSYCYVEDDEARDFMPKLIYVDEKNAVIESKQAVRAIPL